MSKIKVTRNVRIAGKHYDAGDIADVSQSDAITLIASRQAVPYEEKEIVDRSIGLDTSTASPIVKRTRGKK